MARNKAKRALLASSVEGVENLTREQLEAWSGSCDPNKMFPNPGRGPDKKLLEAYDKRVSELCPDVREALEALHDAWRTQDYGVEELLERARRLPPILRIQFWNVAVNSEAQHDIEFVKWMHSRIVDVLLPCLV